jgi:hypothetical protein
VKNKRRRQKLRSDFSKRVEGKAEAVAEKEVRAES